MLILVWVGLVMIALVLIGLAATLLYLSSQNQQVLTKPLSLKFSGVSACLYFGFGFYELCQHAPVLVALLQSIAMMSLVFMVLPVFGGIYANSRFHQSFILKNAVFDMDKDGFTKDLRSAQKYH